jgi:1-acyl-sn-glycerol-3-phosphate acyltransferase
MDSVVCFLKTWVRRACTIGVYSAAALLGTSMLPGVLCVLALWDFGISTSKKAPRCRAYLFFVWYFVCETLGVFASFWVWFAFLLRFIPDRPAYVKANALLQKMWSNGLFWAACKIYGLRIEWEGSSDAGEAPFLLFVRHSSVADTLLAAVLVANPRGILLRYVLKSALLWDPCLDIVGQRLPNAFVDRSASKRAENISVIQSLLVNLDSNTAVLMYPEGTRFSQEKSDKARATWVDTLDPALSSIAHTYQHVLPPRLAGPLALMQQAPHLDVVLLEHVGFEKVSYFKEFWKGALVDCTVHVRIRRFPRPSIPSQQHALWLYQTWADMDRWISLKKHDF